MMFRPLCGSLRALALVLTGMLSLPGHAADPALLDLWQAARQHAPEQQLAEAERVLAAQHAAQADALWRPQVVGTLGAGVGHQRMDLAGASFSAPGLGSIPSADFEASVNPAVVSRVQVQAQWPLYHPARSAQAEQLRQSGELGALVYADQQQQLLLVLATAYYQLALAQQDSRVLAHEQQSLQAQAAEARYRFKIGDSPVTDVHDAEARLAALQARQVANQAQISSQRLLLSRLTGRPAAQIQAVLPRQLPAVGAVDAAAPAQTSLTLQQQQVQLHMAEQQQRQYRPWADVQVNAVALYQQDLAQKSGAHSLQSQSMLGVQASIPLYTGGATALKAAEAAAAVRRAEAQLAQTRSQLDQQIQQASLQLDSLREQQRALDQAVMASQKHLEATRTGRQVGDRTPQDVLNAEQAVASLQHQRDQASTQYLLVWLQLAALKGQLNGQVLQQLSAS